MKQVLVICSLFVFCFNSKTSAQSKKFNQTLADSLKSWAVTDQYVANGRQGRVKDMSNEQFLHYHDSIFAAHYQLLKVVFKQHGYPGFDQVGKEGSRNFWLMVQHCDKWPDFQTQVLKAMETEVKRDNADPGNFAYLTDRVSLNTGGKQLYGTQVTYNTAICQALPRPLQDSLTVNERRKLVGLEPLEKYLNTMSELHFKMNSAVYEAKGIKGPKLY